MMRPGNTAALAITLTAVALTSVAVQTKAIAQPRGGDSAETSPPGPTPRDASGHVLLTGDTIDSVGTWTPLFGRGGGGLFDPLAPIDEIAIQPWAKALQAERAVHQLEPHARCKASAASRQFLTPYGVEIVEIPELKRLYIFDIGGPHTFRTVYLDGRSHPTDLQPSNYGHSIGWWEGDTLVIDTVGYNEDFWLARGGLPHTEDLHTVERLTRINEERIDYELEVSDPNVYMEPFTSEFGLQWNPGNELFEYICQQANQAVEMMVSSESETVDRTSTIVP